jgi:hypothetical protein
MQAVSVGGSVTSTGQILASNLLNPSLGNIASIMIFGGLAGVVYASGAITNASIGGDLAGLLQESLTIQSLFVGGSVTSTGQVIASNPTQPPLGNITTMVVVVNMAGLVMVSGTLTRMSVGGDISGTVEEAGIIDSLSIGGSLTQTGVIRAVGNPPSAGGINTMTVGQNLAGQVFVSGTLRDLTVGGDVSGSVQEAGIVDVLYIGGSLTQTGIIQAIGNPPSAAGINTMTVVKNLAGQVIVSGTLRDLFVGGDVSGSVQEAGIIDVLYIGGSLTQTGIIQAIGSPPSAAGINTMIVVKNLAGQVIVSGTIQDLSVVTGEMTNTGIVNTAELVLMTIGPDALSPGQDMAGQIRVGDTLTELRVAGGTPGTIVAGHVGTVRAYGGYGPLVLQINEAGTQRRVELATPSNPYPILPAPPAPTAPAAPSGVLVQYEYESGGLANPQWTARVSNNTGNTAPDQFDVSLVVWSDTAKFNLARLDANGVSGIRNVAVEGDVLQSVTPRAASFFVLPGGSVDTTPAGVQLPQDNVAGVGVRDFLPAGFVYAASVQALAFGAFLEAGALAGGDTAMAHDAEGLLAAGTAIAQAKDQEVFRVPFADPWKVGFFINTKGNGHFDPQNIVFTDQSGADQVAGDVRGAVTALVQSALTYKPNGQPSSSVVQAIDLRGDAGAIQTEQQIFGRVTSTGPLGDFIDQAAGGIVANVTAPSILGNIVAHGPISSTIQTTGLRTEPTTGVQGLTSAVFGREFLDTTSKTPVLTTTVVQAQGGGLTSTGRLISRADLISQVKTDGGVDGLIAAQGNIGLASSDLSSRPGGIFVNGGFSGEVVALGNILADTLITGQLTGRIVAKGQAIAGLSSSRMGIVGNLQLSGGLATGAAIVSGGEIGDAGIGTLLSISKNKGIVAAIGTINFDPKQGAPSGYVFNNIGNTGPNASAIDAIFTDGGLALSFDLTPLAFDLGGLSLILQDLAALIVGTNGQLTGTKP